MTRFFDTNVLIYAQQASAKGQRARSLLSLGGRISVQVLNEFAAVSSRKFGRNWRDIDAAVSDVLALTGAPIPLTLDVHEDARTIAARFRLSFYDALIVAGARAGECDSLISEDFNDGQSFGKVRVVNPF